MTIPNKHIEEYLNYYIGLEKSPEFAVLLNGEWGCGKTWFIQDYLKSYKCDTLKYLYVSLYGLNSISDIKKEFFKKLNPILASKGGLFTGQILKLATNIFASADLDSVDISSLLTNLDGYLLIFDDIERSSINLKLLLGYINQLVEHEQNKVIIIGDEKKFKEKETIYENFKEKQIGQSFIVKPNTMNAVSSFIDNSANNETKDCLHKLQDKILEVYSLSGFNNLRLLKQSLLTFERMFLALTSKERNNTDFISKMLQLLIAYSLEFKSGTISDIELNDFSMHYFREQINSHDNEKPKKYSVIVDKYQGIHIDEPIIEMKFWEEVINRGVISQKFNESVKNCLFFQDENTPDWIQLWHYRE